MGPDLARIRENQRRSRARRREYTQCLETKYRLCEARGAQASIEIQAAARRVLEENRRLREVIAELRLGLGLGLGLEAGGIVDQSNNGPGDGFVDDRVVSNDRRERYQTAIWTATSPAAERLEELLRTRRECRPLQSETHATGAGPGAVATPLSAVPLTRSPTNQTTTGMATVGAATTTPPMPDPSPAQENNITIADPDLDLDFDLDLDTTTTTTTICTPSFTYPEQQQGRLPASRPPQLQPQQQQHPPIVPPQSQSLERTENTSSCLSAKALIASLHPHVSHEQLTRELGCPLPPPPPPPILSSSSLLVNFTVPSPSHEPMCQQDLQDRADQGRRQQQPRQEPGKETGQGLPNHGQDTGVDVVHGGTDRQDCAVDNCLVFSILDRYAA